jgi:hypothetical protein
MRFYSLSMMEVLSIPLATASITLSLAAVAVDRGSLFFAIPMAALGALWLAAIIGVIFAEHRHFDSDVPGYDNDLQNNPEST